MQTVRYDPEYERRLARLLLDVLIRAGLILVLVMLCYRIFSPFLVLMVWALILAITIYPLHRALAARLGGRRGWAATLITLLGVVLIVAPTAVLLDSMGDSVHRLVSEVQQGTLQVPPPKPSVAEWPVVGTKIHAYWQQAHDNLPALVKSLQPKIGELAKEALAMVASSGIRRSSLFTSTLDARSSDRSTALKLLRVGRTATARGLARSSPPGFCRSCAVSSA